MRAKRRWAAFAATVGLCAGSLGGGFALAAKSGDAMKDTGAAMKHDSGAAMQEQGAATSTGAAMGAAHMTG